jgi:hypothetical protein
VRTYRCSECGVANRAINDLAGMAHTHTAKRPSGCSGHYVLAEEEVMLFESA